MRIGKYLDELQKAVGVANDKELAAVMHWSHSVPSHYRTGKRFMDNKSAGIVSAKIKRPVIEIIAAIEADREEMTGQRSFWTDFFQKTAATVASALFIAVTLFLTQPNAEAAPLLAHSPVATTDTLYIMLNRMRVKIASFLRNALQALFGQCPAPGAAAA
jgi:hypothetical protein